MSSPSVRTEGRDGPSRDTAEDRSAAQDRARPAGAVARTAGVAAPLDPAPAVGAPAGAPEPDASAWQRSTGSPWAVPGGGETAGAPWAPAPAHERTPDASRRPADARTATARTPAAAGHPAWPDTSVPDGASGWDDGLIARRADAAAAVRDDTRPATRPPVADEPATRDTAPSTRADVWSEAPRRLAPTPVEQDAAPVVAPTAPRTVRRWEGPPVPDPAEGPLRRRLGALRELIGLSRARVAPELLTEAAGVLDTAEARGRLSRTHTTIALAGATGSGKSSLVNALAERELSPVGTWRPTTAEPVACTWENGRDVAADDLLDRLGVPPRDRRRVRDPRLRGLVLIDLPDHDSLEPGHREQVDRLLGLVDAVVWVVDPEKYADALLHERYLRTYAGHAEVTFVVLNQTDRLPGEARDVVLDDLRRLLDEDGMALGEHGEPGARVLATSALTGDGLAELREELGAFVAARRAPVRRLTADVDGAVDRLRPVYADPAVTGPACLTEQAREEFEDRLAEAVGATAAGQAAERAWLRQAERACGTPWSQLVRWRDARRHRKGRYGPLVGASPVPPEPEAAGTGELTAPVTEYGPHVARPVLQQAVRDLTEAATAGLPTAWVATVRAAARRGAMGLPEELEAVLEEVRGPEGGPDGPGRASRPRWWTVGTAGQGLLLAVQVLGVFWLVGAATGGDSGPTWVAAALVLCGAMGGPLLGWICLAASRGPARVHGQQEERRLRRLAAGCGRARVLEPVAAELMRYREVREQYVGATGEE
jgi:50S ribosome-binding GTPase